MAFNLFLTEARRTFSICLSVFVLSFISGFIFLNSIYLSDYLKSLFQNINLGVDMAILPKTISPESMMKSLLKGRPEALMPLALFQTLQKQALDESLRKNFNQPPLQLMAILPFQDADGKPAIATVGDKALIRDFNKTIWSPFAFKNLPEVKSLLVPAEFYATDEWKDNTIFGILVNADNSTLTNLKQMIDRRTIAQAYFLNPEKTVEFMKYQKLNTGLQFLSGIILLTIFVGLTASFQKLNTQRQIIFLTLDELQLPQKLKIQLYLAQILFLILIPLIIGFCVALVSFPLVRSII